MKPDFNSGSNQSKFHGYLLFSKFLSVLLLAILLIFPYQQGHCAQVMLAWDPDSTSDLAGYKLYYGTTSGNYQGNIDVGNVNTYTLNNLTIGATYYAAATAYTNTGLESSFSNEVMYTVPACTYALSLSSASFAASGGTGSVSITTPSYCNWTTSSGISWITVNTGSGMGNGSMTYSVSPNTGTGRVGSLTIAGNVFTITEAGVAMYAITASAGAGGSISPSGQVSVQQGGAKAFTVTSNAGYKIADVQVDGVSQGPIASYTFSNVQANRTISAIFTPITYTLSISKNGTGGGTVSNSPLGTVFSAGTAVTLTAASDANSVFAGWSGGCTGTGS
ncbi:MAG: BACON domain-containing carbohydrate-binding protein, partial [Thermodesulfobacteriota bacterium]